jgi:4-amino-4-deoxy-L-arabinose transferase-like glycosyltransferase
LGTTWLAFVIGRKLFDDSVGVAAIVILTTSLGYFLSAQALTPDILSTFWMTATLGTFVCWTDAPWHRRWLWAFFAALGLGLLGQSLIIPVTAVCCALGWQAAQQRTGTGRRIPWVWGGLLSLAIGLSRSGLLAITHPSLFQQYLYEIARVRFDFSPFYVLVLMAGLLPWTFFLPALAKWLATQHEHNKQFDPTWWLIGAWIICPFAVLSFHATKFAYSALPLYPPMALALAAWWRANWRLRSFTKEGFAAALFFLVLTFASIMVARFASYSPVCVSLPVVIACAVAAFGIGLALLPPKPDPIIVFAAIALAGTIVWGAVLATMSGSKGSLLPAIVCNSPESPLLRG